MKRCMMVVKSPKSIKVLSSESRSRIYLDYAESRKTTNVIENNNHARSIGTSYKKIIIIV